MNLDAITQVLLGMAKALMSAMSFKSGDFHLEGPVLLVLTVTAALLAAFVWTLVWLYRDAGKRKKNGIVAVIFVLFSGWPFSFIWWFWLRPPVKTTR